MNSICLHYDQKRRSFQTRVILDYIHVDPRTRIPANASLVKRNISSSSKPQGYSSKFIITANTVSNNISLNKEYLSEYDLILDELSKLPIDWDSDGAEPPNSISLYWAKIALNILDEMSFRPNHITPSVENGIGISFISDNKYADIECFNTGEILAVTSDRKEKPNVWEVANNRDDLKSALENIRVFIRG
jgi:hypothetical protein